MPAVQHVRHVLVRDDGEHARERTRLRRVDPRDPRVRVVGVSERGVQLPGEGEVGRVSARTGHLLAPVRADERRLGLLDGGDHVIRRRREGVGSAVQSSAVAGSYKLVWFVPATHLEATRDAVFVAGAGWIGDYSRCSWTTLGEGTFRGGEGTHPTVGEPGRDERVAEYRVETVVPAEKLASVVAALRRAHPYEEPAFDVYERVDHGMKARLWTDGGARGNPGPAAYAYVLEAEDGTVLDARGEAIGVATNNVAEYSALVAGLRRAAEVGVTELEVRLRLGADGEADARRVPGQEQGPAGALPRRVAARRARSARVTYAHVRREHNELADRLVNEALDAAS